MKRAAILLLALATSGCSWNSWLAKNVKTEEYTHAQREAIASVPDPRINVVATRSAYADVVNNVVHLDLDCTDDDYCVQQLGDDEFWTNHEYGHIVYIRAGQWLGSSDSNQEQGAQCVAEVLTRRGPNFVQEGGYWDCPDDQVVLTRAIMIWNHMMEPDEFPIP